MNTFMLGFLIGTVATMIGLAFFMNKKSNSNVSNSNDTENDIEY